jgi:hypothetical protein
MIDWLFVWFKLRAFEKEPTRILGHKREETTTGWLLNEEFLTL